MFLQVGAYYVAERDCIVGVVISFTKYSPLQCVLLDDFHYSFSLKQHYLKTARYLLLLSGWIFMPRECTLTAYSLCREQHNWQQPGFFEAELLKSLFSSKSSRSNLDKFHSCISEFFCSYLVNNEGSVAEGSQRQRLWTRSVY